jgi:CHASE3 domain sensor protein
MSSLTRQVVVTVLLLGAVLGLFVAAQSGERRLEDASRRVELGAQRERALSEVSQLLRQAESSQRGYILVGDPDYLVPFQEASARIAQAQARLDSAYAKAPPALRADVGEVTLLSDAHFAELRATLERFRIRGRAAALALMLRDALVRTMTHI